MAEKPAVFCHRPGDRRYQSAGRRNLCVSKYPLLVLGVPLVLTVINMGLIYRLIRKVEAQQIARILKGGAL